MNFKPQGYNAISPYFIVDNATEWIEQMKAIFGATVTRIFQSETGIINHAELKIDDSIIMAGQASETYPAHRLMLHIYVRDAHAVYNTAISNNCKGLEVPRRSDSDPDIRGSFLDCAGNHWSVGTQQH